MFTIPLPWPDSSLLIAPPWAGLPVLVRGLLLLALCLVPLLLLVVLYRYELRLVPGRPAFALFGLRLVVFLLVLALLLARPVFARDRHTKLPGRVLIAVDRSASLDVADPQRSPADK